MSTGCRRTCAVSWMKGGKVLIGWHLNASVASSPDDAKLILGLCTTLRVDLWYAAEMATVQDHAEKALQELEQVRQQQQAVLERRVEALEREFREGIADLEQRFLLQVIAGGTQPVGNNSCWEASHRPARKAKGFDPTQLVSGT